MRVLQAYLATSFAWLKVRDDDGIDLWVVSLPLAATPQEPVTLLDYVVVDGQDAPEIAGTVELTLLVTDIVGADVTPASIGDEAVLDPLLPPIEVTGLQAVEVEPVGPRIAELHDRRAELAGTSVRLRGQVWRVIPRVAGLNWAMVRDGSAQGRRGLLLLGTREPLEAGSVIDVQGVLTVDRQLGGRVHDVVLEPARVLGADLAAEPTPTVANPAPPQRL